MAISPLLTVAGALAAQRDSVIADDVGPAVRRKRLSRKRRSKDESRLASVSGKPRPMRFGNAQDAARKTEAFEEEFSDSDRMTDLRPSYQRRRLWSVSLSAQRLSSG